jgi:hypothetical protein
MTRDRAVSDLRSRVSRLKKQAIFLRKQVVWRLQNPFPEKVSRLETKSLVRGIKIVAPA